MQYYEQLFEKISGVTVQRDLAQQIYNVSKSTSDKAYIDPNLATQIA